MRREVIKLIFFFPFTCSMNIKIKVLLSLPVGCGGAVVQRRCARVPAPWVQTGAALPCWEARPGLAAVSRMDPAWLETVPLVLELWGIPRTSERGWDHQELDQDDAGAHLGAAWGPSGAVQGTSGTGAQLGAAGGRLCSIGREARSGCKEVAALLSCWRQGLGGSGRGPPWPPLPPPQPHHFSSRCSPKDSNHCLI